jgi:hypothetical protein
VIYAELIEQEPRLIHEEVCWSDDGLLLCANCQTPASASMSIAVGWIGCGPCITGEAASFDDGDLVLKELPA